MEGVAYDLRMVLHSFRQMIRNVEEIRIVGGGSKSNFWRQIFADIYNTNIVMTNIGQEAAALGAATIASVGTGIWKDFTIVDTIAKTINITHPNNNNVQEYEKRIPLFNFASQKLFEIGEKAKLISDS
jgi:sugar (pentulose or hexulose) kinase